MYELQIFCRGWFFKVNFNSFEEAMEMAYIQESFSGTTVNLYRDGVEVYATIED